MGTFFLLVARNRRTSGFYGGPSLPCTSLQLEQGPNSCGRFRRAPRSGIRDPRPCHRHPASSSWSIVSDCENGSVYFFGPGVGSDGKQGGLRSGILTVEIALYMARRGMPAWRVSRRVEDTGPCSSYCRFRVQIVRAKLRRRFLRNSDLLDKLCYYHSDSIVVRCWKGSIAALVLGG